MTAETCIRRSDLTTWSMCGCHPCRVNTRRLAKLARNGQFNRIPPEQGMAALRRMMEAGMTAPAIADAAGVPENTASNWLAKLRAGRSFRLGAEACRRLVTAKPPANGYVGTTIPRRMLQALARIGWSCDELTRRIHAAGHPMGRNTLHAIRAAKTQRVRAWVANDIAALYRELEMTPGTSDQTIRLATAQHWPGPLSWDNIADPDERPTGLRTSRDEAAILDEAAIERRIAGDRSIRLHKNETAEVVRRLRAAGISSRTILRDYGIKAERYTAQIRTTQQNEEVAA